MLSVNLGRLWLFGDIWRCFQHKSSTVICRDQNLVDNRDKGCPQSAVVGAFSSNTAFGSSRRSIGLAAIEVRFYSLQD
jgi:hypothetical protein